jgi:hypothetical protein
VEQSNSVKRSVYIDMLPLVVNVAVVTVKVVGVGVVCTK